jgi:hypothetical protein
MNSQSDPSQTVVAMLYNNAIGHARDGDMHAVAVLVVTACAIPGGPCEVPVLACKIHFGIGDLQSAEMFLEDARSRGADGEILNPMRREIDHSNRISRNGRVSALDTIPGKMESGASWRMAFSDWIERTAFEICQHLRDIAPSNQRSRN